jgi:GDP-4-dehydro-6-deoxy-D-mannose reductase
VLVTGANGFVGRHLVPALRERSDAVFGLGLGEAAPASHLDGWTSLDLAESEALAGALGAARPDWIVHLAGQSSAALSFERPVETYRANVIGTRNLLEAAQAVAPRARVLVVGTSEVYGPQPEGTRAAEDTLMRPVSPYALSKATADAFADAFGRQHGLDIMRTRSFGHIGRGQTPTFAVPSWAQQIAAIERGTGENVIKVGNLEVTRDLCDVRDVCAAYLALLERGRSGAAYNVCRGAGVRLTQLIQLLVARARVPVRVEVDPARVRPVDVPYLVGDPGAIAHDTGWGATTPLEATLDDIVNEWRERD